MNQKTELLAIVMEYEDGPNNRRQVLMRMPEAVSVAGPSEAMDPVLYFALHTSRFDLLNGHAS